MWLSCLYPLAAQTPAGEPERWADLADTIFKNYGPDDGLPITSVTSFAQDGDGFIWVGTQAGLARWDGYHFRVYRKDSSDPDALQDDLVWRLQSDSQGRLWIGTNVGGVSRYDRLTDKFITIATGGVGGGNSPVRALAEDDSGGMWVGTDRGLDHLGPNGEKIDFHGLEGAQPLDLSGHPVTGLLRAHDGALWIGTDTALMRRDKETGALVQVPLEQGASQGPPVRSLHETMDGQIWVGTKQRGAYAVSPSGWIARPVRDANWPEFERSDVLSIAESKSGELWFGSDNSGIIVLDTVTGHIRGVRHDTSRSTSLPHNFVVSLFHDRSGLLWVGTYSGMGIVNPLQDGVLTAFGGSGQSKGMTGLDVAAVLSAADGSIWTAYLAGGVDVLDSSGHRLAALSLGHSDTLGSSQSSERAYAIAQGNDGHFYLGTSHGLFRAAAKGKNLSYVKISPELVDPVVISLLGDQTGLWIGTKGHGLWHLDNAGKPHRYAPSELADQWVLSIAPAGEGRLWIGSNQGIYLFDPASERIRKILPDLRASQFRSGGIVPSLLTDRHGRLWAAVRDGGGVAVVEPLHEDEAPVIHRIGASEGLSDINVDTLLEDSSGEIWASTASGQIVRLGSDLRVHLTLLRAEGIATRSFIWNSGTVTSHGELLFGGDGVLTIIRPDHLKAWSWHPPVVVTDLRVGGRQIPPQSAEGAGFKGPLEIAPDNNRLTVEFAALDYSSPDRNQYAYRLEGYDRDWVPTDSTRRLASYTNLPPGHYTLSLRGSNRDGVWTEKSLDIPIRVLPAWYQTIWFKAALAVLAVLSVWLLVRVRTSYLRHRQKILEQQVTQRTAELRDTNSQLEARTAELGQSLQEVAESRAKVTNLLDTSGQGFLSFGPDLIVEPDYSRACTTMLDATPQGRRADELLFASDTGKAELFREVVTGALTSEDSFKRDLLLSLLPTSMERLNRLLKLEYRRLDNGNLMVVLTDVTEERRLSKRLESERLRLAMIVAAVTESRDFFDAIESFRQFIRQDLMQILSARTEPASILQEISRQVHTFKGMLAQFNFEAAPQMLNLLEEKLGDLRRKGDGVTVGQVVELVLSSDFQSALETDLTVLRNALGQDFVDQGRRVFLPMSQAKRLRVLAEKLLGGDSLDPDAGELRELFEEFRNLDKIALADALAVYEHTVSQIAKRLDKEIEPLSVDSDEDLWLDPEKYGSFLRSLVHIFRNAAVHGIEDPDERLANGKDQAGRIECVIRREGALFTLAIADDGAGIDLAMLRDRAAAAGLMSDEQAAALSDEEAIALIFADTISVRKGADQLAGRGVGLAAVRAEVNALGGKIAVTSSLGTGTRFLFSFPLPVQADSLRSADMTSV